MPLILYHWCDHKMIVPHIQHLRPIISLHCRQTNRIQIPNIYHLDSTANSSNVEDFIQSITFSSSGTSIGLRNITFTITDGDGGTGSINSAVNVTGTNDAPVLDDLDYTLTTITENDTANTGDTVSSIVGGNITDSNVSDSEGIAITAITGNGTWQYQLNSLL